MAEPAQGPQLKVERAQEQLESLDGEIRRFLDDPETCQLAGEADREAGEIVFRVVSVAMPPLRWSVIVGEILHDLRSALDHLVWELSEVDPDDDTTGFPIWLESENGELPGRARRLIRYLSDHHRAIVESVQPYHAGDRAEEQPLWVLSNLNNRDKHRFLHLTVTGAAGSVAFFNKPTGVSVEAIETNVFGPLEAGAIVARYALAPPDADVEVPFGITTEVAFRQRETPWDSSVVQTLAVLRDTVAGVLARF